MNFVNPTNNPHFLSQLANQITQIGTPSSWLLVFKAGEGFRIERKSDYRVTRIYRWCWGVSYDLESNAKMLLERVLAAKTASEKNAALQLSISLGAMPKLSCKKSFKQEALSLVDNLPTLQEITATPREASTLLSASIKANRQPTALKILSLAPNLEWKSKKRGFSHLHQAIDSGMTDLMRELVRKDAPLHAVDNKQNSPLHATCQKLQVENSRFLLEQKVDVSLKNQDANSACSLPTLLKAPTAVRQFYTTLFQSVPWAVEQIRKTGISEFLQSIKRDPAAVIKQCTAAFAFEISLLFQDEEMATSIAEKLTGKEFKHAFEQVRKKFPHSNLDILYFSQFRLHENHLQTKLLDDSVPPPSREVNLNLILELFDRVNASDSELKCAKITVRKGLEEFIRRINSRASLLGAFAEGSAAREAFYKTVENQLKNILISLQDGATRDTKIKCFREIHKAVYLCAGRYFRTTHKLFLKVCKDATPSFEMEILLLLRTNRGRLAEHVMDHKDTENVNKYNFFVRLHGEELSLPGAGELQKYADQHGGAPNLHKRFKENFYSLYTPQAIQREWLTPELEESSTLRAGLMNWFKEKEPKKWENRADELASWVYPNNKINQDALSYFLLRMENPIFSSRLV